MVRPARSGVPSDLKFRVLALYPELDAGGFELPQADSSMTAAARPTRTVLFMPDSFCCTTKRHDRTSDPGPRSVFWLPVGLMLVSSSQTRKLPDPRDRKSVG